MLNIREFAGRQIGRLFIGDRYSGIFYRTAIVALFFKAFLEVPDEYVIVFAILYIFLVYLTGYFADKTELAKKDVKKTMLQNVEGAVEVNAVIWTQVIIPRLEDMLKRLKEEEHRK